MMSHTFRRLFFVLLGSGLLWSTAHTGVVASPDQVAAANGGRALAVYRDSIVTQEDFDAFLQTIPANDRVPFLRSPERVERSLNNMMLGRRALDLAEASGTASDSLLPARLRLEAGRLAVEHLREQFLDQHMLDDYTEVARELFLTRREEFALPAKVDFAHIVVAAEYDDDPVGGMRVILEIYDQALALEDLSEMATAAGEAADELKAGGHHEAIALDQLERVLAQVLAQMQIGQISEPVRTASGWHLLQLTYRHEPEIPSFEEVRDQAISVARSRHREELIARFARELLDDGIEVPDGAIRELLSRHGVSWDRQEG